MARNGLACAPAEKHADITGALICGGKSKRFGSDKRLYIFEGKRLFDLGFSKLGEVSDDVVAVFREGIPAELKNYPAIYDNSKIEGPIAGLLAALAYTDRRYILSMPCDLPYLSTYFLRFLCGLKEEEKIVIPRTRGLEPLIGLYPRSIFQRLSHYAQQGGRSLRQFMDELAGDHKKLIRPAMWRKGGFSASEFKNLNRPSPI